MSTGGIEIERLAYNITDRGILTSETEIDRKRVLPDLV